MTELAAPMAFGPRIPDATLVRSAREGDRAAFGELYSRHKRMVHGILLAQVSPFDAEDLMQNVFVRALERLSLLRDLESFGSWLAAIARHLAADHHRRCKHIVGMDGLEQVETPGSRADLSERALAAIRRLPEAYRETLILRLVEGMTGPEIAAQTNLSPDSVRVNLCRGMKLLRKQLEGETSHGR